MGSTGPWTAPRRQVPTVARRRWLSAIPRYTSLDLVRSAAVTEGRHRTQCWGGAIEVKSEAPLPCTWREVCHAGYFQNEWAAVPISAKAGLEACLVMAAEASQYMELAGALRALAVP